MRKEVIWSVEKRRIKKNAHALMNLVQERVFVVNA